MGVYELVPKWGDSPSTTPVLEIDANSMFCWRCHPISSPLPQPPRKVDQPRSTSLHLNTKGLCLGCMEVPTTFSIRKRLQVEKFWRIPEAGPNPPWMQKKSWRRVTWPAIKMRDCDYWAGVMLGGGWTNPSEKDWSNWIISPSRVENNKKCLKQPPRST